MLKYIFSLIVGPQGRAKLGPFPRHAFWLHRSWRNSPRSLRWKKVPIKKRRDLKIWQTASCFPQGVLWHPVACDRRAGDTIMFIILPWIATTGSSLLSFKRTASYLPRTCSLCVVLTALYFPWESKFSIARYKPTWSQAWYMKKNLTFEKKKKAIYIFDKI